VLRQKQQRSLVFTRRALQGVSVSHQAPALNQGQLAKTQAAIHPILEASPTGVGGSLSSTQTSLLMSLERGEQDPNNCPPSSPGFSWAYFHVPSKWTGLRAASIPSPLEAQIPYLMVFSSWME
jgi:hypothetical protein